MRVLVTGASQGIGRATALQLAQDGADVAVHYLHHRAEADGVVREISAIGREAFPVRADLGDRSETKALADAVSERWDRLDGLVLNAGTYPRRRFRELTDDEVEACFRVNVFGPLTLARELLPRLERASPGRIVLVSSILAFTGSRHGAHYAASKSALLGLAWSLTRELSPRVTVNVVAPGSIDTAILAGDSPETRAQRVGSIPMGRIGRPEDVAAAISYLLSPKAAYVTGATLHVNGGWRVG